MRVGGMEAALRALRQGNVDVGVLQVTKLTDRRHMQQGEGYSVLGNSGGDQALGG